jgi:hypothetical protein
VAAGLSRLDELLARYEKITAQNHALQSAHTGDLRPSRPVRVGFHAAQPAECVCSLTS